MTNVTAAQVQNMSLTFINKPNLFILGAGKSGTTSLYNYLKQHPSIFMSPIKEPTFFCQDFQVVKNPIRYFELFDSVNNEAIIGDASHVYLTNPSTARVLNGLFPESQFVVVLRNPADRAYSLYHHMRRRGLEWIGTFEKALQAEEERVSSRRFRERCPQYLWNFFYFRSGLYGEQLQRYFSLFDRKQFHILTLEELVANPTDSIKAIFRFLGVSEDCVPQMRVYNEGKMTARVPQLQYFWNTKVTRPRFIRRLGLEVLRRFNMRQVQPMPPDTREALLRRYKADLTLLYDLTGIRLYSGEEF